MFKATLLASDGAGLSKATTTFKARPFAQLQGREVASGARVDDRRERWCSPWQVKKQTESAVGTVPAQH
jgi:hypothetical protein